MKIPIAILAATAAFLHLAVPHVVATVPPEQGGEGTIDPATVNVQQSVRFGLAESTNETHSASLVATDSAGNHTVGSILRSPFAPPLTPTIRSVISKFDRSNNLLWRRERKVACDEVGCAEQYSDDQTPISVPSLNGILSVEVAGLIVDGSDNVIVAFNTFQPDFSSGTQSIVRSQFTLIVKFDANGAFLWRRLTPEDPSNGLAVASILKSLANTTDGGVLALVNNFQPGAVPPNQQSVMIKLTGNGMPVAVNHYGLADDGTYQFFSTPIALTEDGFGKLFLVSTESPDPRTSPPLDQVVNVIRKMDANGNSLGRRDVAVYPGFTPGSSNYPSETWSVARADAAGNLYVAGSRFRARSGASNGPDQGEANQLVLKFNSDLTQNWRMLGLQAKGLYTDQPSVTVIDLALSAGGVTVGGFWANTGTAADQNDYHWEVSRYALDGSEVTWHRLYQAPAAGPNQGFNDTLTSLRVDAAGNVYAAGAVSVATGGVRSALIKYADNGDLQFAKLFPSAYLGPQPSTLQLPAATGLPTFLGADTVAPKEVVVIEFDNPAGVPAPRTLLGNISTRARVGTGDSVLIGGFIVAGAPGSTKKVMLRAIGPSLTQSGVPDALADTTLELHGPGTFITITNDNWKLSQDPNVSDQEQRTAIEGTGIPPSNDLESALVATLMPGPYTGIVDGKGASGVALIEVYDLDQGSTASLANISTRGKVESGDSVMIGGVILLGHNPRRVVVRALGPSLAAIGVQNALQDPVLELHDGNGSLVASNNDWQTVDGTTTTQEADIRGTGVPPSDSRESAIETVLYPSNYTAIVRGNNGTTGVALVEVYALQ